MLRVRIFILPCRSHKIADINSAEQVVISGDAAAVSRYV